MKATGFPRSGERKIVEDGPEAEEVVTGQLGAVIDISKQEARSGLAVPVELAALVIDPATSTARAEVRNETVKRKKAAGEDAESRIDDDPVVVARRILEHLNGPAVVIFKAICDMQGLPYDAPEAEMIKKYVMGSVRFPEGVNEMSYRNDRFGMPLSAHLVNGERPIAAIATSLTKVLHQPSHRTFPN